MFQPMALTVLFALAGAFVLSLTLVPGAGVDVPAAQGDARRRASSSRGARKRATSPRSPGAWRGARLTVGIAAGGARR